MKQPKGVVGRHVEWVFSRSCGPRGTFVLGVWGRRRPWSAFAVGGHNLGAVRGVREVKRALASLRGRLNIYN